MGLYWKMVRIYLGRDFKNPMSENPEGGGGGGGVSNISEGKKSGEKQEVERRGSLLCRATEAGMERAPKKKEAYTSKAAKDGCHPAVEGRKIVCGVVRKRSCLKPRSRGS